MRGSGSVVIEGRSQDIVPQSFGIVRCDAERCGKYSRLVATTWVLRVENVASQLFQVHYRTLSVWQASTCPLLHNPNLLIRQPVQPVDQFVYLATSSCGL